MGWHRKFIKHFHLDVIASEGITEEFTAEKFSKINQTSEKIKKEHSFIASAANQGNNK